MKTLKLLSVLLFIVGIMAACDKKEENETNAELIGKWRLIEILMDPGDGSGTFSQVESSKVVEFQLDGTITSNGSLCGVSTASDFPSEGIYSLADSTMSINGCVAFPFASTFKHRGEFLFIHYSCDEPCAEKYKKN